MHKQPITFRSLIAILIVLLSAMNSAWSAPLTDTAFVDLIEQHCVHCHDAELKKGKLDLDSIRTQAVSRNTELWEKVFRKLDARQMPPVGKPRPTEAEFSALTDYLFSSLNNAARAAPNPGRTDTFRRLNRTEYQNAIRDLLALDIDAAALLPPDESSPHHGG